MKFNYNNLNKKKLYLNQFLGDEREVLEEDDEFINIGISEYNKIRKQLGELIILFNSLEAEIQEFLCFIIINDGDELGMLYTGSMPFQKKVNLLETIIKRYYNLEIINMENYNKAKNFIITIKNIIEYRNKLIHGYWEEMTIDGYIRVDNKFDENGVGFIYIQINNEIMKENNRYIRKFRREFYDFFEYLFGV